VLDRNGDADRPRSATSSRIADIAMTKLVRLPRLDHDDDIRQEMLVAMFLAPRNRTQGRSTRAGLNAFAYLMKTAIRRGNKLLGTLAKKREKDDAVTDYLIDRMRRAGVREDM